MARRYPNTSKRGTRGIARVVSKPKKRPYEIIVISSDSSSDSSDEEYQPSCDPADESLPSAMKAHKNQRTESDRNSSRTTQQSAPPALSGAMDTGCNVWDKVVSSAPLEQSSAPSIPPTFSDAYPTPTMHSPVPSTLPLNANRYSRSCKDGKPGGAHTAPKYLLHGKLVEVTDTQTLQEVRAVAGLDVILEQNTVSKNGNGVDLERVINGTSRWTPDTTHACAYCVYNHIVCTKIQQGSLILLPLERHLRKPGATKGTLAFFKN